MPRRRVAAKRDIIPDPKFNNVRLAKFMNHVMVSGKKSVAERIVYGALEIVEKKLNKDPIEIFTDSKYVKNGITEWINTWVLNNWKTSNKEDVKNKDLWIELYKLNQSLNVKWNWVKAHAGDTLNEEVDILAKEAAYLNRV